MTIQAKTCWHCETAKRSILRPRRTGFHKLRLALWWEAPSFHLPLTDWEVFLNTGVMQSQSSQGIWLGRWWPISGNCSSSDSWRPTSPPLITAAWVWRTPRGISRARTSQGKWATVQWGYLLILKAFNPPSENSFSLQERSENKHASQKRKNNHAACIRCASMPGWNNQQICPSVW